MRDFLPFLCAASWAVLIAACDAQSTGPKISSSGDAPIQTELPERIKLKLQSRPAAERKSILRSFDKMALDGAVSRRQIQNAVNIQYATSRAIILQQLLSLDTNGDAQISAKEMLATSENQIMQWQKKAQGYMPYSEADLNGDDIISLNESFIFSQKYASRLPKAYQPYDTLLAIFDTNNDGNTTRDEITTELDRLEVGEDSAKPKAKNTLQRPSLRRSSTNKNTKHSSVKQAPEACIPTPPKKNAEVIFLSGYEGSGLSSVAVTGLDRTTEVARLVIEKGDRPLYIMASSYTPLIWSIEGDTKRVAKFVVSRNRHKEGAGVGVVGLAKNKIDFLGRNCLSYFKGKKDSKTILAKAKWSKLIDRQPDHVLGAYTINSMRLPSGENKSKKKRGLTIVKGSTDVVIGNDSIHVVRDKDRKNDFGLSRYSPEGLLKVDIGAVMAPEPVKAYDVYPQEAGIVQLVEAGQLEPLERGSFRIKKPVARFPAGLAGAHSVKFILGKGVPLPKGNPGHSSIYSEETGECLTRSCR